jgi:hypothetical protein
MSFGKAEKPCKVFRIWPINPGLCGRCAWPELEHEEKPMKPHQQRVVNEKKELDEKLTKLHAFCFGGNNKIFSALDPSERDRLESQYSAMKQYSDILEQRIANF